MASRASRTIGWNASPGHALWAAVTGFLAAALTGLPLMWLAGAEVPAESFAAGWAMHLAFGLAAGAAYGLLVWTRGPWKGAGIGAVWGLLVGFVWALLVVPLVLPDAALAEFGAQALLALLAYALWGAVMGALYALVLRATRQRSPAPGRARRHA